MRKKIRKKRKEENKKITNMKSVVILLSSTKLISGTLYFLYSLLFFANPFIFVLTLEENDILFGTRSDVLSWIELFIYLLVMIIVKMKKVNLGKQGLSTLVVRDNHELTTTSLYRYLHHLILLINLKERKEYQ